MSFWDDGQIPIWNGALPDSAILYINNQIKDLSNSALVIALKTDDYLERGFCGRAEFAIQKTGRRFISINIPREEETGTSEGFISEIIEKILSAYFI